jgi:PmbA protein
VSGAAVSGQDLLGLAERIVAGAGPGEQVEAYVARSRSTSVRVHGGEVESLTVAEPAGAGIRVIVDGRQGFAHCGTLDEEVLRATLAEARDNARFAEPDPWAGLADPDGVVRVVPDEDTSAVEAMTSDARVALALDLERRTTTKDPRVTTVRTATYGDAVGAAALASTTGIAVWSRSASAGLSVAALAKDDSGTTTGGSGDASRHPGELDVARVADEAVQRATQMLGAGPVPSCRLAVVFEPRLAVTLLGLLAGTLSGEALVKGRSLFADRQGEPIASPLMTLVDDPTDLRSLASSPYDDEGLATRRNVLVRDGVLETFLHNTWTARRLGTASTASAVRGVRSTPGVGASALAVTPGQGTLDELIAGIDHGLLVQSLTGLHSGVNMVSGDVSVGAEGILIRNGALAEPVREVTLASTLQRMLLGITAVGADIEWLPGGDAASTIVIGEMSLSGN